MEHRYFLFTIDVEDWFQVENFKPWIPFSSWELKELRVEFNIHRILDLFDSIELASSPKATFFVLGWVAKRLPKLIQEIHLRGHEIASHGYNHFLCSTQRKSVLRKDLQDSKELLEDIIGDPIYGYRAPSFSISDNIINIVKEAGYIYDSSYNSAGWNKHYGKMEFAQKDRNRMIIEVGDGFYELPISNYKILKWHIPLGGGGYFRLWPQIFFRNGVKSILSKDHVYLFYIHPWEIDPEQPRVHKAFWQYKFRHYLKLHKTEQKLIKLMQSFSECKFLTCIDYLRRHIEKENNIKADMYLQAENM